MSSSTGFAIMTFDVSVVVKTYNHANCILKCIESIYSQHTTLRIEVLICDDASTDNTCFVIDNYVSTNTTSFSVRRIYHTINLGHRGLMNGVNGLKSVSGRYVTILDGDDYWLDPEHIQKLFDAFSSSEQMAGVTSGHVKIRSSDGETIETCACGETSSFQTLADLEFYPLLGASMWKRDIIFSVPDELIPYLSDTMLWHFIAKQGQCVALPYVSLCYNITGDGVHTRLSFFHVIESHVELYMRLHQYEKSSQTVGQLKFWLWWAIEICGDRGDYGLLKKYSKQLVAVCECFQPVDMKIILKYKLLSYFPFLLSAYKKLHSRL